MLRGISDFPKLPVASYTTTPHETCNVLEKGFHLTKNGASDVILFWKCFPNHPDCLFDFLYHRYYANQKKTLEVNPRHPLVKELLKRVETDKEDKTAKDLARVLFETATLRSGYLIKVSLTLWMLVIGSLLRVHRLDCSFNLQWFGNLQAWVLS